MNFSDQLSGKNITPGVSSSPESETAGGNEAQLKTAAATNLPENSSLGLLLSDITSLILLSLSTEKFLQKGEITNKGTTNFYTLASLE